MRRELCGFSIATARGQHKPKDESEPIEGENVMKTFDIERRATELEQNGYTVIHNVMPPSELEATKQAIEETLDAEEAIGRKYGLQNEHLRHAFNAQGKHPHFYGLPLRNPEPVEVARRVLGEDMFAHDVAIRTPMPTGKKDATRLGGNLHADWADFTVRPFIGGVPLSDGNSVRVGDG